MSKLPLTSILEQPLNTSVEMTPEEMNKAYNEGKAAYLRGEASNKNPYPESLTSTWCLSDVWYQGWLDA